MSKMIVEMEMPTVCDECPMMYDGIFCAATGTEVYPNRKARILKNGRAFDPCENRLDDCPIIGVLPDEHGDLIDKETAKNAFDSSFLTFRMKDGETMRGFYQRTIDELPVLIAAERKDDEQIH